MEDIDSFIISSLLMVRNRKRNVYKTYLAHDGKFYKIGKAVDPQKRISSLKNSNPSIKLIHIIDENIEHKLHVLYKNKKQTGEWFKLNKEDVQYIKSL